MFWDNGFKTVAAVANADPQELLPILMQAQPNKIRLEARDEQKYKDKLLLKAKVICDSANRLWREFLPFLCPKYYDLELLPLELECILIILLLQSLRCGQSTRKNRCCDGQECVMYIHCVRESVVRPGIGQDTAKNILNMVTNAFLILCIM